MKTLLAVLMSLLPLVSLQADEPPVPSISERAVPWMTRLTDGNVPFSIPRAKKSPEDPLQRPMAVLGGPSKFQRLETLSYTFDEVAPAAGVRRSGRVQMRLHESPGLRIRRDWKESEVSWTAVLTSSGPWATRNGVRVEDRAILDGFERDLSREALVILSPFLFRELGRTVRPTGAGYFLSRLLDRLVVEGEAFFPGGEGLTLHLNQESGRVEGFSYGSPAIFLSLSTFEETKSLLQIPTTRLFYDDKQQKSAAVRLTGVTVNGYVDESLFEGATP
jgi:hypothetical protein